MKFIMLVEGHPEHRAIAAFLKRWLDPRLDQPVGVKAVRSDGWQEFIKDVRVKAHLYAQQPDVIAVIGLLDLYGPTIYPDDRRTAPERYDWMTRKLESDAQEPRFRQFMAVHELEAWILSDPSALPRAVREALPKRAKAPEAVNFDEPPKQVLRRLYRQAVGRAYKETTDGVQLLESVDPNVAYERCPYLKGLFDCMLGLASAAMRA